MVSFINCCCCFIVVIAFLLISTGFWSVVVVVVVVVVLDRYSLFASHNGFYSISSFFNSSKMMTGYDGFILIFEVSVERDGSR